MKVFWRKRAGTVGEVPLNDDDLPEEVGKFTGRRKNGDDTGARLLGFKISLFLNVIQAFSMFGLVLVMQMMTPLQRTIPFLIEIGDVNERTISSRILKPGSDGERIGSEWEAMRYVKYRYEVLPVSSEMSRRWAKHCVEKGTNGYVDDMCGFIFLRSTPTTYEQFLAENSDINSLIKQRVSRVVNFESEGIFKGYRQNSDGKMEIQWEFRITVNEYGQPKGTALYDCEDEENQNRASGRGCFLINSEELIVQMWTVMDNVTRNFKARFLNPMGFKVTDFVATPVLGGGA